MKKFLILAFNSVLIFLLFSMRASQQLALAEIKDCLVLKRNAVFVNPPSLFSRGHEKNI